MPEGAGPSRELPPRRGRSLTPPEYVAAFVRFVRMSSISMAADPLADLSEEEIRARIEREIEGEEERSMIRRFVAGEPWPAIRESVERGRRY